MSETADPPLTRRAVVVTGASSGIGRAICARIASEGALAFAGVRREEDAASLKNEFGDAVHPLLFDVTNEIAVRAAAAVVRAKLAGQMLFGLVNNAGVAVPGPLLHLDSDELRRQLEINLIGVHAVTRAFAPLLGAEPNTTADKDRAAGRIVMISSVAGRNGAPMLGAYSASKHALEGYSESLRRELMLYGVDVIIVAPGAIATPIWQKGRDESAARFGDTPYAQPLEKIREYLKSADASGLPADAVGALVWRVLTIPNPKTRYSILRRPFMDEDLPRLMPKRVVDRAVAKRIGLTKTS
jgi:NAD(P)-dependent dehydrogenase (short-subunit alcohol dehydrogenase family)